jgi:signal transduction histidine kinase
MCAGRCGCRFASGWGAGSSCSVRRGLPGQSRRFLWRWLTWAAVLAATGSLAATAWAVMTRFAIVASEDAIPYADNPAAGMLGLLEAAMLLVLLAIVVRTAPPRTVIAIGLLLTGTHLAWLLRLPPPPTLAAGMATALVWLAGPVTAGIAGGYPRLADARRKRSVEDARRAQRLHLAGDLHDFVAHDLTGIVVQAQSAQHLGSSDPAVALEALRRIEAAGLHALASMDQALSILSEGDSPRDHPEGASPRDLRSLLDGFAIAGGPSIEAHIDEEAWRKMPAETTALGYRVLAEALTNVRRHAPHTSNVRVSLGVEGHQLALTVANQLSEPARERPSRGGRGLRQLASLVADGGGALTAGPDGEEWRLQLTLPLPEMANR